MSSDSRDKTECNGVTFDCLSRFRSYMVFRNLMGSLTNLSICSEMCFAKMSILALGRNANLKSVTLSTLA